MRVIKPVIIGISGPELTDIERELLKEHCPLGVILFRRNIKATDTKNDKGEIVKEQDRGGLTKLIIDIKETLGEESIICIDQEGGRVKKLIPPTFYDAPSMKIFGEIAEKEGIEIAAEKCKQNFKSIAKDLKSLGINLDFAPVADLIHKDAHDIVGDRSFGSSPDIVVRLCLAALKGLAEEGIRGCVKHLPGHGRAKVDSHKSLPIVDASLEELEKTDFLVFKQLAASNTARIAMTAHIVYKSIDPHNPATLSEKVIKYIRNDIGFKGFIISDAIDMKALNGSPGDITKKTVAAGIDIVLECTGEFTNMVEVFGNAPEISIDKFSNLFV